MSVAGAWVGVLGRVIILGQYKFHTSFPEQDRSRTFFYFRHDYLVGFEAQQPMSHKKTFFCLLLPVRILDILLACDFVAFAVHGLY